MRSPTFTLVAAFAGASFSVTRPERQSSVAADRVGVRRTAHNQASRRTESMATSLHRWTVTIAVEEVPGRYGRFSLTSESRHHAAGPVGTAVCLAAAAGFVDAYVYTRVVPVFVANMSGNLIHLGLSLGGVPGPRLAETAMAIAF